MNLGLLTFTDGRADYLDATITSFRWMVDSLAFHTRIIVNDCPDPAYQIWLESLGFFDEVIPALRHRRGFAGAVATGWAAIDGADYVFHLEDDFTFNREVDVQAMVDILETHPHLAQMALRRQPWNDEERQAGGIVELHPDDFLDVSDGRYSWLEHRRFFTTNPCVYPATIVQQGWPIVDHSEGIFSLNLFQNPQTACGFWGQRADPPWVTHIGEERTGTGY